MGTKSKLRRHTVRYIDKVLQWLQAGNTKVKFPDDHHLSELSFSMLLTNNRLATEIFTIVRQIGRVRSLVKHYGEQILCAPIPFTLLNEYHTDVRKLHGWLCKGTLYALILGTEIGT
jgi:hypothetical protein